MNDATHRNGEVLSRQQAAERLTDLAYALVAGGVPASSGGRRMTVAVPEQVGMLRGGTSTGGRIRLQLEITWSTGDPRT